MVDAYADACTDELANPKWDWPGVTKRRNGEVVGSPRDRVDTGELIDSLVITQNRDRAHLEWEAPHASIVHDGWLDQSVYPGTPWTETALEEIDLNKIFIRALERNLR